MEFTYEILYNAWRASVTLNSTEQNRMTFRYNLDDNLLQLQDEIENRTFMPAPFRQKKIIYPKRQIAQVPAIRDKIVQHAMYDNGLYEMLTKPLIDGASACLRWRGDSYASQYLIDILRGYHLKYGKHFYCLKCDIKSYFASIPHERVFELIDRYVTDEDFKWIMRRYIDQMPVGLALGLPQSQALANLYLSELDHKVKEVLHARYYARHMDDFYIISNDIGYLEKCLGFIREYVESIGLTLNPKTGIFTDKIDFLGFTYHLTDSGKVVMRLIASKRRSKRRELKKKLAMVVSGELTAESFAESYGGWRAHALTGCCRSLVSAWDEWLQRELGALGYKLLIHDRSVKICQEQSAICRSEPSYLSSTMTSGETLSL